MKDIPDQAVQPPRVAPRPKASGEPERRAIKLSLGSSAVWTERMLAALERGITGGKWHSLIDKVWEERTLAMAAWAVIRKDGSAGVDGESCEALEAHLSEITGILSRQLREDRYRPRPVKRVWIPKLGSQEKRPLGVPVVRDRVVQTALLYVLEPIFEREFAEASYGFRPGRNARRAIERVERLLHEGHLGYERVWSCPEIDMIYAPAKYGTPRSFEGASGYLLTVDSLDLRGKLVFHEVDHTTHIARDTVENGRKIPGGNTKLPDAFASRQVLRREFALTRVKRTALWWFDFLGGNYASAEMMVMVA